MSKPDGDAMENRALLSATELQAQGHFVQSPSDVAPALAPTGGDTDDREDKTYKPPKHSNALDGEAPQSIYASDGEEVTTETEYGRMVVSTWSDNTVHSPSL